jgi:multimeric flavodoxin WrbA
MIHASDNLRSNTVWLGRQILQRLPENFSTREISLQNGTIHDCRGCSYAACLHFSQSGTCFYGGAISQEVLPAIRECDAMLFLCPNYNDAVSANLMALFNRMTNLLVQQELLDKYLFGIVVSGYSGSDIVARQLLGALCFNKTVMLPPQFAMLETAHDPGSAKELTGVEQRLDDFAAHMVRTLQE